MAGFFHMMAFQPLSGRLPVPEDRSVTILTEEPTAERRRSFKIHRAWFVAGATLIATVGAAGFRATPAVMIDRHAPMTMWPSG
jgi:hypothetical protein